MIHRLTREEIDFYLDRRAGQGFNVVQTVLLSEFDGLKTPNPYGDLPLFGRDPTRPDTTAGSDPADPAAYDYWDHAEFAVRAAAQRGILLGLVSAWGEYVVPRAGGKCFDTPEQAYAYGHFLGTRFRGHSNIVWILGGDRHPDERPEGIALWRAMAEGIADGTNGVNRLDGMADWTSSCMTHHSYNSSSNWFHGDPWIDFHMWGSYHADFSVARAHRVAADDWNLPNPKPTLNAESAYEDHPVNWLERNGRFTAYDTRQAAYWSVFSGACGHTYGCHSVWQFYNGRRQPISLAAMAWQEALDLPGACQMGYLRRLIESKSMFERIPDQTLISGDPGDGSNHAVACCGRGYALVYLPTGYPVTIRIGKIEGREVTASWFDPRTGEETSIGTFAKSAERAFDPPGMSRELEWLQTGRGCDWVLVLEGKE